MLSFNDWQQMLRSVFGQTVGQMVRSLRDGADGAACVSFDLDCRFNGKAFVLEVRVEDGQQVATLVRDQIREVYHGPNWLPLLDQIDLYFQPASASD